MRHRLPPLNPLRAFEATARRGTVASAAEELNVTASAVSHQIRALETSLGVDLFVRTKARVKLTPQGEALIQPLKRAFDMIATAVVKLDSPVVAGDLVVSAPMLFTSRWLARHIGDFLAQFPAVTLKLVPSNDDKEVYSADIDLCVRYGDGRWRDRDVTFITHPVLFPVVGPALMNGERALRTVQDLAHRTLFCEHADSWQRWLAEASATQVEGVRILEIGIAHVGIEAALHGQGVALGDSFSVSDDLADGTLIRPFSVQVPAKHAYYWVCRPELSEAPCVAAFMRWAESKLR